MYTDIVKIIYRNSRFPVREVYLFLSQTNIMILKAYSALKKIKNQAQNHKSERNSFVGSDMQICAVNKR